MKKKTTLIFCLLLSISMEALAQCNSWIEASSVSNGQGAWSVTTDNSNNVYSTGSFTDTISFGNDILINNTSSGFSYYVNKFNSSGAIQWAIQFESSSYQFFPPVIYQKNGALYVAGVYNDTLIVDAKEGTMLTSPYTYNYFLLKLDLNGNLLWAKDYKGSVTADNDAVFGINVNNINQVCFTGRFEDTVTFGLNTIIAPSASTAAFLTKTDSNGNVIWAIQSTSIGTYCRGWGITTDNNENVIIGGLCNGNITYGSITFNANNTVGGYNPYVAKFDSTGNCQWIIGGQGPLTAAGVYDVVTDPLGNIYFAGELDSTVTFNTTTLNPANGVFYYAKYSSTGNLVWVKQTGNSNNAPQTPSSLVIDASNNLWMSGWVWGSANFGNYQLNDSAMFVVEFDTSGTILNAIGSKGTASGYTSALDGDGNLYVGCFAYLQTLSFDGSTITVPAIDTNGIDVIFKYCTSATGINQLSANNYQLSIYPNPSSGTINIVSSKNIDELKVFNLLGQLIYEYYPKQTQFNFKLQDEGMYFVTVTSDNQTEMKKVIVSK